MYSHMSMRISASGSSKRNCASTRASSVLPTPVGPEEDEGADRPARVAQAGAVAADRLGDRRDRLLLADDGFVSSSSMRSSFSCSLSSSRETGIPVIREITVGDVVLGRPRRAGPLFVSFHSFFELVVLLAAAPSPCRGSGPPSRTPGRGSPPPSRRAIFSISRSSSRSSARDGAAWRGARARRPRRSRRSPCRAGSRSVM